MHRILFLFLFVLSSCTFNPFKKSDDKSISENDIVSLKCLNKSGFGTVTKDGTFAVYSIYKTCGDVYNVRLGNSDVIKHNDYLIKAKYNNSKKIKCFNNTSNLVFNGTSGKVKIVNLENVNKHVYKFPVTFPYNPASDTGRPITDENAVTGIIIGFKNNYAYFSKIC